jgi:hypothetical protein
MELGVDTPAHESFALAQRFTHHTKHHFKEYTSASFPKFSQAVDKNARSTSTNKN